MLSGRIATYISFLPLLYALVKIRAFRHRPYVFLLCYFIAGAVLNWGTSWFAVYANEHIDELRPFLKKWEIDDTFFIDPLYFIKNFVFLGSFTYYLVKPEKIRKWIVIVSVLCLLFTCYNTVWGETYKVYQAWGSLVDNLYKLFIGFVIIRWIFNTSLATSLTKIPYYYFALAILVIGAFAGLIDLLSNFMFNETSVLFYQVHIGKNVSMCLAFLLFTVGIHYVYPNRR